jgi:hypothetical protein
MMLSSLSLGIFDYMFVMSHDVSLVFSWNFTSFRSVKRTPVFLGAFAKLRKATISFVISVRSHGTTRLPLEGFSRNFMF